MISARILQKGHELLRYRDMFMGLVNREIRARYKGSLLGFMWSLLNPLLMLGIYSLIFSVYLRIDIPNYPLFLFSGLLAWNWFSVSIVNATATIVANGNLIKKVYFPHELLPMVNVTTNLINYLLSLPVLFLLMLLFDAPFSFSLLYFPLLILIQYMITLGISLFLCTANAFFRDVEQLLGPLLLAWLYLTPVMYPASLVPEKFKFLYYVNPMAPLIGAYQGIFVDGRAPSPMILLYCAGFGLVLIVLGYTVFNAQKFKFSEVV